MLLIIDNIIKMGTINITKNYTNLKLNKKNAALWFLPFGCYLWAASLDGLVVPRLSACYLWTVCYVKIVF